LKRLALAAAALATGVAAFFLVRMARDGGSDTPDPGITRPISGHDAGPTPPRPSPGLIFRPDAGQGASGGTDDAGQPATNPGQRSFTFEDEARDPAWADEHERELTLRMRKLVDGLTAAGTAVNVDAMECRRSLCRVTLHVRDTAALSKAYGALETEQGLVGWADNILYDSVEIEDDGQVKAKVTAVFNRD
jgi:hypothetical protein